MMSCKHYPDILVKIHSNICRIINCIIVSTVNLNHRRDRCNACTLPGASPVNDSVGSLFHRHQRVVGRTTYKALFLRPFLRLKQPQALNAHGLMCSAHAQDTGRVYSFPDAYSFPGISVKGGKHIRMQHLETDIRCSSNLK